MTPHVAQELKQHVQAYLWIPTKLNQHVQAYLWILIELKQHMQAYLWLLIEKPPLSWLVGSFFCRLAD